MDTAPLMGRDEVGVEQTAGIKSALLDMLTLRFLVDIQAEMLGRWLACLDLRKGGDGVINGRSSA